MCIKTKKYIKGKNNEKIKKISCAFSVLLISFSLMADPAFAEENTDKLMADGGFIISNECELFGENVLSVRYYASNKEIETSMLVAEDLFFHAAENVSEEQINKVFNECEEYYNIELSYVHNSDTYFIQVNKLIKYREPVENILRMICQKLKFSGLISDFIYYPYYNWIRTGLCEDTFINYSSDEYDILTKYVEEKEMNCKVTRQFHAPPESDEIDSYCSIDSDTEMSLYDRVKQAQKIYADTGCKPLKKEQSYEGNFLDSNAMPIDMYNEETDDVPGVAFGDIDNNQSVDIGDLVMLSQFLLHDKEPSYSQSLCADIKYDKIIDITDLATLKQYIMKDKIKLGYQRENNQDIVLINVTNTVNNEGRSYGEFYDKLGNKYEFSIPDISEKCGISDRRIKKEVEHAYRIYKGDAPTTFSEDDMESVRSLINHSFIDYYEQEKLVEMCYHNNSKILYGVKYNDDGNAELIHIRTEAGGIIQYGENCKQIYDIYSKVINRSAE